MVPVKHYCILLIHRFDPFASSSDHPDRQHRQVAKSELSQKVEKSVKKTQATQFDCKVRLLLEEEFDSVCLNPVKKNVLFKSLKRPRERRRIYLNYSNRCQAILCNGYYDFRTKPEKEKNNFVRPSVKEESFESSKPDQFHAHHHLPPSTTSHVEHSHSVRESSLRNIEPSSS